ncbi:MAG: Fur family transcriptional regulator [Prevotella sp.]
MREKKNRESAQRILTGYLEANHCRKTPERFAVLDAVYNIEGKFTPSELSAELDRSGFRVSRATLYNSMRLFTRLRLVERHVFQQRVCYEACRNEGNYCFLTCISCGHTKEIQMPVLTRMLDGVRIPRFSMDSYTIYIKGLCKKCQKSMSEEQKKTTSKQNNSK